MRQERCRTLTLENNRFADVRLTDAQAQSRHLDTSHEGKKGVGRSPSAPLVNIILGQTWLKGSSLGLSRQGSARWALVSVDISRTFGHPQESLISFCFHALPHFAWRSGRSSRSRSDQVNLMIGLGVWNEGKNGVELLMIWPDIGEDIFRREN
jgi:hypothetical protein